MLTKAFRLTDVKALDEQAGTFSGFASVYGNVDQQDDVVLPGAFTDALRESNVVKICYQHDPAKTIGLATLEDTERGLFVKEGRLELALQDARDAYVRLKSGLLDGISIGYETLAASPGPAGIRRLERIKLLEVSLVTFPANVLARVTAVKGRVAAAAAADDLAASLEAACAALFGALGLGADPLADVKAGRALSAPQAALLEECRDAIKAAHDRLDAVARAAAEVSEDPAEAPALAQFVEALRGIAAGAATQ